MKPPKPFWGLLRRRECLLPTWRGLLALLLVSLGFGLVGVKAVHPFLAVTDEVPNGALVVEGWQPDYALAEVAKRVQQQPAATVFVTGGPLDRGGPLSEYRTYAELGAASLRGLGVRAEAVQAVPAPTVRKDRTYASARALGAWLREHQVTTTNFNLVTMSVHARRSRLMFQEALGEGFNVGVIAVDSKDYDARRWWRSSAGVRAVISEILGYIYARFFFRPESESN